MLYSLHKHYMKPDFLLESFTSMTIKVYLLLSHSIMIRNIFEQILSNFNQQDQQESSYRRLKVETFAT